MLAMSDPVSTLRGVGRIVQLEEWRRRRPQAHARVEQPSDTDRPRPSDTDRLKETVERLEPLVRSSCRTATRAVERELVAIIGAVEAGRLDEALVRAERLTTRLQHPSTRAARQL
jgi:hypothetical protein